VWLGLAQWLARLPGGISYLRLHYKIINSCSAIFLLPSTSKNAHRVGPPGPDPSFLNDTDPDPVFYFDADPDPNPSPQSDANLRPMVYRPSIALI
jgi:hypothetical protein